jgi:hypothetical protein
MLNAVAVLALSAAPAGATIVCFGNAKPPSPYCTNIKPIATTVAAAPVSAHSATLNGVAGPNWPNGDRTSYLFQYGRTTAYGKSSRTGTIPRGPAATSVSATIGGLRPSTTYHFRIVAFNPDGRVVGADKKFTTAPVPIRFVHSIDKVKHGDQFDVTVSLNMPSSVVILLLPGRKVIASFDEGLQRGTMTQTITAPNKTGKYTLRVTASANGTTQTINRTLTVT